MQNDNQNVILDNNK